MLPDREQVGPYQGVVYLLEACRGAAPAGGASTSTGSAKGITAHTRFSHHARYRDTVHHARFNLRSTRGYLDVERLDVFNADRLHLRRQGFHRRKQLIGGHARASRDTGG